MPALTRAQRRRPFEFLSLPYDVRLMVYEYLTPTRVQLTFSPEVSILTPLANDARNVWRFEHDGPVPSQALSLMQTCHTLRSEVRTLFYANFGLAAHPSGDHMARMGTASCHEPAASNYWNFAKLHPDLVPLVKDLYVGFGFARLNGTFKTELRAWYTILEFAGLRTITIGGFMRYQSAAGPHMIIQDNALNTIWKCMKMRPDFSKVFAKEDHHPSGRYWKVRLTTDESMGEDSEVELDILQEMKNRRSDIVARLGRESWGVVGIAEMDGLEEGITDMEKARKKKTKAQMALASIS